LKRDFKPFNVDQSTEVFGPRKMTTISFLIAVYSFAAAVAGVITKFLIHFI
jgi:hypothetical protein